MVCDSNHHFDDFTSQCPLDICAGQCEGEEVLDVHTVDKTC